MLPPGQTMTMTDAAVALGMPREEAAVRFQRINSLRRASVDRERMYWNAVFKLGGGPSAPLRLLQEALKSVNPGVALDMGMGRGATRSTWQPTGGRLTGTIWLRTRLRLRRQQPKERG